MKRLTWAAICCVVLSGSSALAEANKPRNILEWMFGQSAASAPTSIAPPQAPQSLAPQARSRAESKAKAHPAKVDAKAKSSIRKPAKAGEGGETQHHASGPYSGPFRGAGNQAFCVRSCDGYFFPINFEGAQGNDRYDTACQTSCPGAETQVFFMKRGGDIRYSSTARGVPYSSLANALKYRKERDASCSCKTQEQRWATILAPVEGMMKPGKSDITVTEETSQKIAQGADLNALAKANEKRANAETAQPVEAGRRAEVAADPRNAATMRSVFDGSVAPAGRFNKFDTAPTGSVQTTPQAKPASAQPALPVKATTPRAERATLPVKSAMLTPAKDVARNPVKEAPKKALGKTAEAQPAKAKQVAQNTPARSVDKAALRQTLNRLLTPDQR